ncbi:hypothetical protein RAS1_32250 [Phycisphaerae bacterium RAS1]|nr:hypothetical protein RAS1_32250 [Phycisphaerae bacterium RAS1]
MFSFNRSNKPLRAAPRGRRTPLAPELPPEAPPPAQEKSWIKISVVEDATCRPLPGVTMQLTQPNGKTFDFTTRADGAIEVYEIDLGDCSVACNLEGARMTDTFGFVATGREPSGQAETADPKYKYGRKRKIKPAPAAHAAATDGRIADVEQHKVKSGESIDSLAQAAGLTWQQLAIFNFGTADPVQINRFLAEKVGCSKKTADGANYMFDDKDDPGIIFIPKPWRFDGLAAEERHVIRVKLLKWKTSKPEWDFSI